ncbi:hypothetical protein ABK040_006167 [Willaertia magna]
MEETNNMIIKLYLSSEHIRRFQVPTSITFDSLKNQINSYYRDFIQQDQSTTTNTTDQTSSSSNTTTLNLQYQDDDGDWTLLSSEEDWYIAKAICTTKSNNIKIRLANFYQTSIQKLRTQQQVLLQSFNKEKKLLLDKGNELCKSIGKELKKISELSNKEEVKTIERAVQDFCNQVVETVIPVVHKVVEPLSNSLSPRGNRNNNNQQVVIDEDNVVNQELQEEEEVQQSVEEQMISQMQQQSNIMEKSGFIWVNPTNNQQQQLVEQEPIPVEQQEPIPVVEPVVVEEQKVEEPIVEPTPIVQEQEQQSVEVPPQQQQVVEQEEQYNGPFSSEISLLQSMGFMDREKSLNLLMKYNGNIQQVINDLLN